MEKLETINDRLKDVYGADTITGLPIYRIVWSHEQFERRLVNQSDEGIVFLYPEVRLVPKYRHYIHNKWVLENLVQVPEFQQKELGVKINYEPLFVFETNNQQFLPYKWEACVFVIATVNAAKGKESMFAQYVDPDSQDPEEKANERIEKLQKELFGNETDTGDALAHKQGVAGFHSKMDNV